MGIRRIFGSKVAQVRPKILFKPQSDNGQVRATQNKGSLLMLRDHILEAYDSEFIKVTLSQKQKANNEKYYCIIICCDQYATEMSSLMLK